MADVLAWIAFAAFFVLLWPRGIALFARSALSLPYKLTWTAFLVAIGVLVGALLPLPGIRGRFLIVLVLLPVLAIADTKIARSNRSFTFWLRACAFEVGTVFALAALTRLVLDAMRAP